MTGTTHTIHWRHTRLFVNAGMAFPTCYANARLLDTDKSRLPTSGNVDDVTCKRCLTARPSRTRR